MLAVLSFSFGSAWPENAHAKTPEEEAETHKLRAYQLVNQGDFAESIVELEKAYRAVPNPGFLGNIALVYDQWKGHCREADAAFARFFKACESCPFLPLAQEKYAQMKPRCEISVTIKTAPPGAALKIDGEDRGKAPISVLLLAGRYELSAALEEYTPKTEAILLEEGKPFELTLQLEPVLAARVEKPPITLVKTETEHAGPAIWPFWTAVGVATAATTVTLVFNASANNKATTYREDANIHPADRFQLGEDAKTQARNASIVAAVAAASGAVAAALWLIPVFAEARPTGWIAGDGASVGLGGSF
jgi:hypothetical protein